jgi:hypothetical protein
MAVLETRSSQERAALRPIAAARRLASLRLALIFAGLSLGLSACGSPAPEPPKYPVPSFQSELPLTFDAQRIEVRSVDWTNGGADSDFPVSPIDAVRSWAQDRLHVKGHENVLRLVIFKATGLRVDMPYREDGKPVSGKKTVEEEEVVINATLEIVAPDGGTIHSASASVSEARNIAHGASQDDRQQACYELLRDVMAKFDQEMEAQIRDTFGPYLLSR